MRTIYIGGQDAIDGERNIVGAGDIAAQTEQVRRNLRTALEAAGAAPEHVVKWNVLIVEGENFRAGYAAWERWSRASPTPTSSVEMDATAIVPA